LPSCSSMILLRFFGADEFDAELKGTAPKRVKRNFFLIINC